MTTATKKPKTGAIGWAEGMQILREWRVHAPGIVWHQNHWHVFSRTALISSGATVAEALDHGGFLPRRENPTPTVFVAHEVFVLRGNDRVAEAQSKTLAQRIANALNEYIPGDRGF